jgi:hypothetical protein
VQAAARAGVTATRLANKSAPSEMTTTVVTGTVGEGTTVVGAEGTVIDL